MSDVPIEVFMQGDHLYTWTHDRARRRHELACPGYLLRVSNRMDSKRVWALFASNRAGHNREVASGWCSTISAAKAMAGAALVAYQEHCR